MRILIATPTYDRRIDIDLAKLFIDIERAGKHSFDYIFPVSSHISRNRNVAVKQMLEEGHEAILFLDSDIGIYDVDFIDKLIETAYKFDAQIVGGAYRMKKPDVNEKMLVAGLNRENVKDATKPMFVDGLGTGIMLIFRDVFTKVDDPWFTIVDGKDLEVVPEDFHFCNKAREKGIKVVLDPRFKTKHYGTYGWEHI